VSHFFGLEGVQLLEAFKASLKFKVDINDTESQNEIALQFERRKNKDRYIEGWLHKQLFESDGEPMNTSGEKFRLPMLLQALCSGNPNGNFNTLLGHAWGPMPPDALLCAIEAQFCCLLTQQEIPSALLHDPEQSYQNDNVYDVIELVLQSLKWMLEHAEVKSPLDNYVALQNKGLEKEAMGWLLGMLNVDDDSRPSCRASFLLLLFHCILAGNPNQGGFVKELSFAWGISAATLRGRNEKTVSHFLGPQDSELLEAFKASLKFKVNIDDTESRNEIELHFERRKNEGQYVKGWLHEQFFESNGEPMDMNTEKFKIPILLQALCSGNPNGSFNKLLGEAWGPSPPARLLSAVESQFHCLMTQKEIPPKLQDPEQLYENDNCFDVTELVLQSLQWTK
jgi:hypothetical protein